MPFRILAQGVTFWFELPPDQAPSAHFALGFVNCSHLSLEGATLDRDAASLANAVAENPRWQNDGWEIRNCDCRFTRIDSGICRRIRIEGNVFEDMAIHPDGVTLQVGFQSLNHAASTPLLSNLTVRGNRFINTGRHAIDFRLVSGGEISGNTFTAITPPRGVAWILTKQSKDIRTTKNQFPAGTTEMKSSDSK